MNNPNIIISEHGIEIYRNEIAVICDEYIQSLPQPENITKSVVFSGMLFELSNRIIKPFLSAVKTQKGISQYYNDYDSLNSVFYNIYIPLCTQYGIIPSVLQFSVLCDIDNAILGDIKNGVYRANGSKVNPANSQTVKKWFSTCESFLLTKATNESSIGSIFALKANYNYNDNLQKIEIVNSANSADTPAQIMEKYKDIEPPIIDMNGE